MRRIFSAVLLAALFFLFAGCASNVNEEIEHAKFALDSGDWDSAIFHAREALTNDPSSVQAALQLSAAYAGRSGFRVMSLLTAITDERRERDLFDAVREAIGSTISRPEDLRTAIEVLIRDLYPQPSPEHPYYLDYFFQLGVFMAMEGYGLPSIRDRPDADGPIDVRNISEEDRQIVEEDFIGADEYLVEGGIPPDNDLVENVRQTYCALVRASGIGSGFDLAALRDITLCQLSPDDGAGLLPGDFESPNITGCGDFDYSPCAEAETDRP